MCPRKLLFASLALSWGILVYFNAFDVHQPRLDWVVRYFWPPIGPWTFSGFMKAQAANVKALLALAVFDVLCWGFGMRALAWLRQRGLTGVFALGVRMALGAALMSFATLGLALAGLAYPVVYAALGVLAAGCLPSLPRLRLGPVWAQLKGVAWPLKLLAGLLVIGVGAGAMAPEVTDDALRFFLEVPRRTLLLHRLVPEELWPFTWNPPLSLGLNLPLMALADQAVVKLFNWQAWVFVAVLIFSWLKPYQDGRLAPLAAVAWLAMLNVPVLAQTAMVDCQVAAWVGLAAWAQFRESRSILAGLLWGGALGVKYQAGFFLAGALVADAVFRPRIAWRVLVAATLAASFWLLRNALQAGAPWAPFWMSWEPGGPEVFLPPFYPFQDWVAERGLPTVLAAPFTLATGLSIWDGLLSPWLVAGLPLAFSSATPARLRVFLALSLALWAWQAGGAGRYLLPLFPVLIVGIGQGCHRLVSSGLAWSVVFALLAYEACLSLHWAYYILNPTGVALGKETRPGYLRRLLTPRPATWDVRIDLQRVFAPATRYYLAGSLQAHYWPGLPVLEGEGLAPRLAHWAHASPNAVRLRVKLRQRGLRYLVHHETSWKTPGELRPRRTAWTPRALAVYRECFSRYARLMFRMGDDQGSYAVYEFLNRPGPPQSLPERLPL